MKYLVKREKFLIMTIENRLSKGRNVFDFYLNLFLLPLSDYRYPINENIFSGQNCRIFTPLSTKKWFWEIGMCVCICVCMRVCDCKVNI